MGRPEDNQFAQRETTLRSLETRTLESSEPVRQQLRSGCQSTATTLPVCEPRTCTRFDRCFCASGERARGGGG